MDIKGTGRSALSQRAWHDVIPNSPLNPAAKLSSYQQHPHTVFTPLLTQVPTVETVSSIPQLLTSHSPFAMSNLESRSSHSASSLRAAAE